MSEPFALIDATLRGMVLSLLLLVGLRVARDRPRAAAAQAGLWLTLGLAVQVASSTPLFEQRVSCALQSPLVGVAVANAVSFWLFVQALFDDAFVWRARHAAAWGLAFVLGSLHCGLLGNAGGGVALVSTALLRAVPLVCALLALRAAAAHWRDDLVESRRRLRAFVVVTGVLYTLAMLAARLALPTGRLDGQASLVDVSALLAMAAVIAWRLLRVGGVELFPEGRPVSAMPCAAVDHAAPPPMPPPDAAEERLAQALQRAMQHDHAYRSENLTVATLAARLAVPEYRLRRLINQRLGHRNFNAYVNAYRLEEACAVLADPASREQPVLGIALEAGFQSIGPFNRAFKAATGLTPTQYRRQKLADS
jgi:AraC-like DNA-binding protein